MGDQMQFTLAANYASISNVMRPLTAMTGKGITSGKVVTTTCLMIKE